MQHWLLVRGRGERPLERLHGDPVTAHSSSKRPSVEAGDLAVLYASVWQAIYGIAEVAGAPGNDPARTRWAWRFPLRARVVLADLDRAPAVEEMGVFPSSLWRHSYIRLTREQFEQAEALLTASQKTRP
ncbi:MAG: hypothetical protein ACJ77E_06000 [Gaiellaceae bacterium]